MKNAIDVFINHEKKVVNWSDCVLAKIKTFATADASTRNKIDECSDILNKIIASCETFLDILNNTTTEDEDENNDDKPGAKIL